MGNGVFTVITKGARRVDDQPGQSTRGAEKEVARDP